MQEPKIKLEHVNKVFQTRTKTIEALRDINIEVNEGEFVSIIGPSGCGKSTIIRLIDDIIKPTDGKITVDGYEYVPGQDVPQDIIRKLGFIFQLPNLLPWKTVKENIMFPLELFRDKDPKWSKYVDELLERVDMSEYADAYPSALSGGMKQRVGVLRAMSYQPPILLMDEPFGALDALLREQLDMETLKLWKALGQTVIFITHNVYEAVLVSDRIYVMGTNPGRIVKEVKIDIPRPRNVRMQADKKFVEYVDDLLAKIGDIDLTKIV